MKNIHILPTDKPSKLHLWTDDKGSKLELCDLEYSHTRNTQNIYITSDEEIKDGWHFNNSIGVNKPVFVKNEDVESIKAIYGEKINHLKKIILTTDQDLIKDGVQAIDDEFLEWFVKNPSCERVEVNKLCYGALSGFADAGYKIIISKEESKQSTKGRIMSETSEETKQKAKDYGNSLVTKTETLQEAANKYASYNFDSSYLDIKDHFIAGYELAQERSYSEEDMNQYSDYVLMCSAEKTFKLPLSPKQWFKINK